MTVPFEADIFEKVDFISNSFEKKFPPTILVSYRLAIVVIIN